MPAVIGSAYPVPGGGGGGGGGTPTVVNLTSAPHAGWTQIPDPKAFYDVTSGKTFFGPWVNGTSGDIECQAFDSSRAAVGSAFALHSALSPVHDNHNSGSLLARRLGTGVQADGKLVAAYTGHDGGSHLVRRSTNAADATAWQTEQNLNPGNDFTYETLIQLASGTIYRFYRNFNGTGRLAYQTSTDGGDTWGSETLLYTGSAGNVPYWRIVSDWNTRIDVFITDVDPSSSKLYHFYLTASNRFKSDGTTIATSLPLTVSDLTLVLDNADGPCWSWGGSWDGSAPATIIMQSLSGGTDCKILRGKWNGSSWVVETIVANVGGILDSNRYGSGCGIHHENPDICLVSRKTGARWQVWRYQRAGGIWTGTQLTSDASVDNVWADFPVHCDETILGGFWLHGTYGSDTSFDFGIQAEYLA